jgi:preprotein translocase subunit SecA
VHEQKDPLVIYKFEAYQLFTSMLDEVNKDVVSFLFKGELPERENANIREASNTRRRDKVQTRKDEIQNLDERSAQARQAGQNASNQGRQIVETIVRDKPKIGRNDIVTIKNVQNGENKKLKYKKAQPMINQGQWVLIDQD